MAGGDRSAAAARSPAQESESETRDSLAGSRSPPESPSLPVTVPGAVKVRLALPESTGRGGPSPRAAGRGAGKPRLPVDHHNESVILTRRRRHW